MREDLVEVHCSIAICILTFNWSSTIKHLYQDFAVYQFWRSDLLWKNNISSEYITPIVNCVVTLSIKWLYNKLHKCTKDNQRTGRELSGIKHLDSKWKMDYIALQDFIMLTRSCWDSGVITMYPGLYSWLLLTVATTRCEGSDCPGGGRGGTIIIIHFHEFSLCKWKYGVHRKHSLC